MACWLAGAGCGSVIFFNNVHVLRTASGSSAPVSGATLYLRATTCVV
jgi:hypothetical protein